jgi:predicted 3-demethylubiquinone-9 3-methyltransferase (glyoxalase superfamily)
VLNIASHKRQVMPMETDGHCTVRDYESTDWAEILSLYVRLLEFDGSPVEALNRAVVVSIFESNDQTQAEVDGFCKKLSAPGNKMQCGWLKDKYGVSWQIVPAILSELLFDKDPEKSQRVMQALLRMEKLDIKKLKQAY